MTRKEHPHAEALRDLADGFELQAALNHVEPMWEEMTDTSYMCLAAGDPNFIYRKKPEVIRFRVAKYQHNDHPPYAWAVDDGEAATAESREYFRGWITEWIEVEA